MILCGGRLIFVLSAFFCSFVSSLFFFVGAAFAVNQVILLSMFISFSVIAQDQAFVTGNHGRSNLAIATGPDSHDPFMEKYGFV